MRILQIIFSLSSGGAEKTVVNLSNELAQKHEVHLCTINSDESRQFSFYKNQIDSKIHYYNLNAKSGFNLRSFYDIFKLIKSIKPDVVHAHLNTIIYLYLPALLLRKNIRYIHTLHNIASKTISIASQKTVNHFFYKSKFITPVAISKECKTSFKELYNLDKIDVVENGIPKPTKSNLFKEVKNEITGYKTDTGDIVFVHVARYSDQKNQKLLINVFNELTEERNDLILLLIGIERYSEGERELRKLSNKKVKFLGLKENVSDYLMNSDIFILSSLWEGLPISLLEAISCETIPICTPAGGIPDVIKNDTIGFVSVDFTKEEFKKTILKCLDGIDSFDRSNLTRYYNDGFSIKKCAGEYVEIYSRV